jgi:chromatin structure-remodeling complex subunit RSC9
LLTQTRAYEIKTFWNREPPPVEILEKLTAKGGDILSRTVENFQPPKRSTLANGESDSEGEEARTPKEDRMEIDDPSSGGAGGRSTRGEASSCEL